jgi:predicted secreted protein
MAYTRSQAFAGRSTVLQYSTNPPSVPYVELQEIKTIGFTGTKADMQDVTNMNSSNVKEWLPTLIDSGDLSLTGNLIPNDQSEVDLINFFNNQTLVFWEVVLPAGGNNPAFPTSEGMFSFTAYVQSVDRTIPVEKEATITVKLKITGKISFQSGS